MSNEESTLNQKFEAISDKFAKDDQEHFVGSGTALNVARALKAELAVNKKIAPIEIENITPLSSGRIEEMSSRSSIYTEGNSYSTYETASENSELSEYQLTPRSSIYTEGNSYSTYETASENLGVIWYSDNSEFSEAVS